MHPGRAVAAWVAGLALLALVGCGRKGGSGDAGRAAVQVDSLIRRHHQTYGSGDLDSWGSLFTPDAFMIAADPSEAIAGRDSILAEIHRDFDPASQQGLRLKLTSLDPWMGFASDSQSAWVSDRIAYGVDFGGQHSEFEVAMTGIAARGPTGWTLHAVHYARTLAHAAVESLAMAGALPSPREIGEEVRPGAAPLLGWFRSTLAESLAWLGPVARDPGVAALGPEPGQRAVGRTDVRALIDRLGADGRLQERPGGARVGVVPGGALGWVAVNLQRSFGTRGRKVEVPYRALLVYRREAETWALVQAHLSHGQKDSE